MNADRARSTGGSLDIDITRDGGGISVSARSRTGAEANARLDVSVAEDLAKFTKGIERVARARGWLDAVQTNLARELHATILGGDIGKLMGDVPSDGGAPLLVRLGLTDSGDDAGFSLHDVPWEALCAPQTEEGFWGSSPEVCLVRRVPMTGGLPIGREVRGPMTLLAIAPEGENSLTHLESAFVSRVESGEMAIERVIGERARGRYLPDSLMHIGRMNIVHFVGHAGVAPGKGKPFLVLGNDEVEGEAEHLPMETFAQQLKATSNPRLVVLECCEGAKRGDLASAGEFVVRAGVDAVMAHLFPVRADFAARCSALFYANLAGKNGGDVAWALQKARLDLLTDLQYRTAAVFAPVLYLRSTIRNARIFDFTYRTIVARPKVAVPVSLRNPGIEVLENFVKNPFSLILGDAREEQRQPVEAFRKKLQEKLPGVPLSEWSAENSDVEAKGLPTSALAQQFEFHKGRKDLMIEYGKQPKEAFRLIAEAMGARIGVGIHVTLLHEPFLEDAIVRAKPDAPIYVLRPSPLPKHPDDASLCMFEAGNWVPCSFEDKRLEPNQAIIIVRLFNGKIHGMENSAPWLTEDDYLCGLRELEDLFPKDIANQIEGHLQSRPTLCIGVSLRRWHHRATLQKIFERGIPKGSLALVEPAQQERELWEKGAGLPGRHKTNAFTMGTEDIARVLLPGGDGA